MHGCAWDKKYPTPRLTPAALTAWNLFQLMHDQWNVGMSGATGIPHADVEAGIRLAGLEVSVRSFELFQLLKGKRLSIWAEERAAREEAAKRKGK
jgi:hypothetical protein